MSQWTYKRNTNSFPQQLHLPTDPPVIGITAIQEVLSAVGISLCVKNCTNGFEATWNVIRRHYAVTATHCWIRSVVGIICHLPFSDFDRQMLRCTTVPLLNVLFSWKSRKVYEKYDLQGHVQICNQQTHHHLHHGWCHHVHSISTWNSAQTIVSIIYTLTQILNFNLKFAFLYM